MAFIQYAMQIIMAFLFISMVSIMMPRAQVAAERVNEILDMEVMIKDPEEPKEFLPEKKVKLNLKMYISAILMQMKQCFIISVLQHQLVKQPHLLEVQVVVNQH